jgi:RNA polymerase sigma factor (sigma-70 family)
VLAHHPERACVVAFTSVCGVVFTCLWETAQGVDLLTSRHEVTAPQWVANLGRRRREPSTVAGLTDADMESLTHDLVRRALAGDRQALRQLFVHVICPVVERKLARRLAVAGADRAALHDHVQEVLVHLLERDADVLRRWDPARGALEPYLGKVAENFLISRLRRRPPPSPSDELDSEAAVSATPEDSAAFSHLVLHLLREISDSDAELFRAVYLEELSPDEAAARLGITRDAAHKRIQRLRGRLTRLLSNPDALAT